MNNINFYLQWFKLTLAAILVLTSFTTVEAQTSNQAPPRQIISTGNRAIFIQPLPRQGTPKGTVPAGSRGCSQAAQNPLTALVPAIQQADGTELRWGLTTEERPNFWFYVPYKSESILAAKFALRDRTNRTLYEIPIKLTQTPGVISISVGENAPPLENNQWYRLYLFIDISCPGEPSSREKVIAQAWVRRETLTPALNNELEKATKQQKAILYAKNGIWFEALTTVAELRRSNPQDAQWNHLLQSAGFGAFANEQIVDCCTVHKNLDKATKR